MSLSCKNISCARDQVTLLQNVNFDAEAGMPVILTGPNGSGKTTLLKTLAGLMPPQKGTVLWENRSTKECYNEYAENLVYLGHKTGLKNELTVEENLNFWAELNDSAEAVAPAIMYFGLIEVHDISVEKISEGQKRRAMLARLLCCPSQIWLLDEPTNNLDEEGKELLKNIIKVRAEQGGIIIISSHHNLNLDNSKVIDVTKFIPEEN